MHFVVSPLSFPSVSVYPVGWLCLTLLPRIVLNLIWMSMRGLATLYLRWFIGSALRLTVVMRMLVTTEPHGLWRLKLSLDRLSGHIVLRTLDSKCPSRFIANVPCSIVIRWTLSYSPGSSALYPTSQDACFRVLLLGLESNPKKAWDWSPG